MTPDQETTPPSFTTVSNAPRPVSFGSASFVLNAAQTTLTFTATFFNIDINGLQTPNDANDNLRAAHIHAPAPERVSTGVVWGFFGTPDNDTNPKNLVITPFASGVGGSISGVWDQLEGNGTSLTAQVPNILAGLSYINFHTNQNTGGEIRGQIVVVPEPGTLALLGSGFVLLGGAVIRGRRRN
jgi:hypothetical protein